MAKKKKKKGGGAKKGQEMIIVQSKAKEVLKGHGCRVASDALEGLNAVCHWYLEQAAKRANANNQRKTVRAHDFMVM